mmetsp:Transcript_14018/g.33992  ORF Transcript_14018/g.33992 Transcript_14018/m.33992 type:complete len:265 (-) Transcript_14018:15-809(-)
MVRHGVVVLSVSFLLLLDLPVLSEALDPPIMPVLTLFVPMRREPRDMPPHCLLLLHHACDERILRRFTEVFVPNALLSKNEENRRFLGPRKVVEFDRPLQNGFGPLRILAKPFALARLAGLAHRELHPPQHVGVVVLGGVSVCPDVDDHLPLLQSEDGRRVAWDQTGALPRLVVRTKPISNRVHMAPVPVRKPYRAYSVVEMQHRHVRERRFRAGGERCRIRQCDLVVLTPLPCPLGPLLPLAGRALFSVVAVRLPLQQHRRPP